MAIGAAIGATITATQMYLQHRKEMRERRKERREQKKRAKLTYKRQQAIAAGYHPLAALGVDVTLPPAQAVGAAGREFARHSGQAIGEAIDAYKSKDDREIESLAKREMRAKVLSSELDVAEAIDAYKRRRSIGLGNDDVGNSYGVLGQGNAGDGTGTTIATQNYPGLEGQAGAQMVNPEVPWSRALGIQAGVIPLHMWNWREDGTVGMQLTKENQEMMESDLGFKLSDYLYRMKKYLRGYGVAHTRRDSSMRKRFNKYWSRRLPQLPKTHMWVHMPHNNRWKLWRKSDFNAYMQKIRARDVGERQLYQSTDF